MQPENNSHQAIPHKNQNSQAIPHRAAPHKAVYGALLAGGKSTRFGGETPKQLVSFEGEPVIRRLARRALESRLSEVFVLTQNYRERVEQAVADLPVVAAEAAIEDGLGGAVRGIAAHAAEQGADAVMIIPIDQPLLSTRLIDRLIETYSRNEGSIVAPSRFGLPGSPVIFDRRFFADLAAVPNHMGGKSLFRKYPNAIVRVPVEDPWELADMDTRAAFQRIRARHTWRRPWLRLRLDLLLLRDSLANRLRR